MEDFVKTLGGWSYKRLKIYYDNCGTWGHKRELKNYSKSKAFGIKITIPRDNLKDSNSNQNNKNQQDFIDLCYLD